MSTARPEVAVIGSGVAGLTAAHLLQRRYEVTLFEADDRLGGHAHTHEHLSPEAGLVRVDSGFIVHNRVTYPNLMRLFDELWVRSEPTTMSMSVRCEGCGLEYAGALGLGGVFAQTRSVARPRFLRMLFEVDRFHRHARKVLSTDEPDDGKDVTLGHFLTAGGYSPYFVSHFMVPVVSAVWSSAPETALQYPARYLFAFLANHGMLSVKGSHQWYTVAGGSRTYVDAVGKGLNRVRTGTPVRAVERLGDRSGVDVTSADGVTERYSAAVIATHRLRRLLVLALTAVWGLRLAGYIAVRSRGQGEDPRYAKIFKRASGNPSAFALKVVFLPQAFLSWFVSIPVQMAMYLRSGTGALTWIGTAVWVLGATFETVGDAQMARFKADPANKGLIMDRGLWRYTRHPNYFGDAAVWTGLFLIAAQRWPGITTVLSPFAMIYFLYFKSGKRLLEKSMAASRPGYREYMERTSGFLPLPPKQRR